MYLIVNFCVHVLNALQCILSTLTVLLCKNDKVNVTNWYYELNEGPDLLIVLGLKMICKGLDPSSKATPKGSCTKYLAVLTFLIKTNKSVI